jgi:hypothetical protein
MAKRGWAPDFIWMEPLRVLLTIAGPYSSKFDYWHRLIGGSQGQFLYYLPEFCSLGEPFAPDWTFESLVTYGPNEVLRLWAEREIYRIYCEPGGGGA